MTLSRSLYVLTLLRTLISSGGADFVYIVLRKHLVGTALVVVCLQMGSWNRDICAYRSCFNLALCRPR